MERQLKEIREQQKASWNKFSAGWKSWDDMLMNFMQPMADEMIRSLSLQNHDKVLDVASGTGEPGLTIAAMLKSGKVIITDISEKMLLVAREKATEKGLANIETVSCDVCEMPFADNHFDAISCRFGFMFFPDMLMAAKEMHRVLKPGGKLSTAVWDGPEKNFWVTAIMGVISTNMALPPPPPGSPGMFRCAATGFMTDLFLQAGFKNVGVKTIAGKLPAGTTDVYWDMMNDVGAPIVAALSKADDTMQAKIKAEVYETVNQRYPEGEVFLDSAALVIYGEK